MAAVAGPHDPKHSMSFQMQLVWLRPRLRDAHRRRLRFLKTSGHQSP